MQQQQFADTQAPSTVQAGTAANATVEQQSFQGQSQHDLAQSPLQFCLAEPECWYVCSKKPVWPHLPHAIVRPLAATPLTCGYVPAMSQHSVYSHIMHMSMQQQAQQHCFNHRFVTNLDCYLRIQGQSDTTQLPVLTGHIMH